MIYYIYNGDELLGFIYNSNTYYYHKNIFGDIIGILDTNYNEIVTYEYDSWGLIKNITDSSNINLGTINPFRYRSYYYDEETNLYYLNSRYYNPEWGRFVNEDNTPSTGQSFNGMNMFNYCGNNPIVRVDDLGQGWLVFACCMAGAGFIIGGGIKMASNIATGGDLWDGVWGAAAGGAISGFFATTPFGMSAAAAGLVGTLGSAIAEPVVNYFAGHTEAEDIISDAAINVALSYTIISEIKINSGWYKPQSVKSSFTGNYGKKVMSKLADEGIQTSVRSTVLTSKNTTTKSTKITKTTKKTLTVKKSTYTPQRMISTDPKVVAKQQQERREFLAVTSAIQNNLKQKVCYVK